MFKKIFLLLLIISIALSACGTFSLDMDYDRASATPSPSESDDSELGWITLTGVVRDSNGALMAGESVMCQQEQVSNSPSGPCAGIHYTDADGRFAFGPVLLRTSDTIVLWAVPSSDELKEIKRSGSDVWKQPDFEFIYLVQPTPSVAQLSADELGWVTITGVVRQANGDPLAGETVSCQLGTLTGNRRTNAQGRFSCGVVFLHDTDQVTVHVIAGGYAEQNITRSGTEIRQNPSFDFNFSQAVTPTPFLDPQASTPTPTLTEISMPTPTISVKKDWLVWPPYLQKERAEHLFKLEFDTDQWEIENDAHKNIYGLKRSEEYLLHRKIPECAIIQVVGSGALSPPEYSFEKAQKSINGIVYETTSAKFNENLIFVIYSTTLNLGHPYDKLFVIGGSNDCLASGETVLSTITAMSASGMTPTP